MASLIHTLFNLHDSNRHMSWISFKTLNLTNPDMPNWRKRVVSWIVYKVGQKLGLTHACVSESLGAWASLVLELCTHQTGPINHHYLLPSTKSSLAILDSPWWLLSGHIQMVAKQCLVPIFVAAKDTVVGDGSHLAWTLDHGSMTKIWSLKNNVRVEDTWP